MYYESDYAQVEWDSDVKVANLTWKKFASGDDFRTACSKALELAKSKNAIKWYSDTTQLGALKDDDTAWFMENIVKGMLEAGIKQQALIIPASVISKMSLNRASESAEEIGLETQYFSEPEKAMAWLKG